MQDIITINAFGQLHQFDHTAGHPSVLPDPGFLKERQVLNQVYHHIPLKSAKPCLANPASQRKSIHRRDVQHPTKKSPSAPPQEEQASIQGRFHSPGHGASGFPDCKSDGYATRNVRS